MLNKTEENCTGCRACEKICPTHSIQMYYNSSGFLMPEVNWNKCNKCSKCINVCPENEKKELKKHYTEIYAIKAKSKEDSIDSATAGLFYMIAKKIIEKKGVVFGCIWKDKLSAIHIGTSEIKLLDKMRGSKYVQSDTKNVYVEIQEDLKLGKKVLFSGTGCQIAGLYSFLGKEYNNLYTVEILCHGVPSPKLFKKYISWLEKRLKCNIDEIHFRDKTKSGWGSGYKNIIICGDKEKSIYRQNDTYCLHFIDALIQRKVCYQCRYTGKKRVGNLVLGDFWGVQKYYPDFFSDKGVAVAAVTDWKGYELLELIDDRIEKISIHWDEAAQMNEPLRTPIRKDKTRDIIYKHIDEENLDEFFLTYMKIPFDLGAEIKQRIPYFIKKKIKRLMK